MKCRIDHWIDGDTAKLRNGKFVRLEGVRAQEKHQFGSEKATRTVAGMIGRSNGWVEIKKVGSSYGRDVVKMWNRDGSINQRMKDKGYKNKGR